MDSRIGQSLDVTSIWHSLLIICDQPNLYTSFVRVDYWGSKIIVCKGEDANKNSFICAINVPAYFFDVFFIREKECILIHRLDCHELILNTVHKFLKISDNFLTIFIIDLICSYFEK